MLKNKMEKILICLLVSTLLLTMYAGAETKNLTDDPETERLYLLPVADGSLDEWKPKNSENWNQVNDPIDTPDEDNTYIHTSGSKKQTFNISQPDPIYEESKIYSVQVFARTKHEGRNSYDIYPSIYTHGKFFKGNGLGNPSNWMSYCSHWSKNPKTKKQWTWDEIKNLEIGIKSVDAPGVPDKQKCTQIYAVVNLVPTPWIKTKGSIGDHMGEAGSRYSDSFKVYNDGDPGSELNWEILSHPDFGSDWTFDPPSSNGLTPEDGKFIVNFSVTLPYIDDPDDIKRFDGKIKLVNIDNTANFKKKSCSIPVTGNLAPDIPTITGPTEVIVGQEYEYFITSTDPGNDLIRYIIDWGDSEEVLDGSDNNGFPSGETISVKHTWTRRVSKIEVTAKDSDNAESNPAVLSLTMGKNKEPNTILFDNFFEYLLKSFPLFQRFLFNF